MTCQLEDDVAWVMQYNSSAMDFMLDEERPPAREIQLNIDIPESETTSVTDDLLNFLENAELTTKTPVNFNSANFKSIDDPLPSYDENFPTITNNPVEIKEEPKPSVAMIPHSMETLRLPSPRTPFSPSDVLVNSKKTRYNSDPILNFDSIKKILEEADTAKHPGVTVDACFKRENSMSLSLNDISDLLKSDVTPPNNLALDTFCSPLSPNSMSSDDSAFSSGISDHELSPRRGSGASNQSTPGPTRKARRRKVTEGGNCPHLWQFLLELLGDKAHAEVISWTGEEYHFKVHNSRELARLWGDRKNKPRMNFDKLSRAMRYYYDKNIIRHIAGQRLVYEFCPNDEDTVYSKLLKEASQTMPEQPIKPFTSSSLAALLDKVSIPGPTSATSAPTSSHYTTPSTSSYIPPPNMVYPYGTNPPQSYSYATGYPRKGQEVVQGYSTMGQYGGYGATQQPGFEPTAQYPVGRNYLGGSNHFTPY